jgi:hypothetical protein
MNYRKILTMLSIATLICTSLMAQDFKYVGSAKCKMCHNKPEKGDQFNKWAASPHAKAMEKLKGPDATNAKCLKCHSTAAGVDTKLIDGIKVEEGVSCESCHGPGSAYKSPSIMKSRDLSVKNGLILPDEKVCKKCHNEESPNYKGFNFAEYSAKIAHADPTRVK